MDSENTDSSLRLSRRKVIQWFAAAAAAPAVPFSASGQANAAPAVSGYGTDPDMMKLYERGDLWPLTLTADQRKTVTALSDTIFPDDELGPAASKVKVPDFIDEWVSAPYPSQVEDREVVIPGLAQFEKFMDEKYGKSFSELSKEEREVACQAVIDGRGALNRFFEKFATIAASAYYSTKEGWVAIGYAGNVATATFEGPPKEVLEKVGVEQTVI